MIIEDGREREIRNKTDRGEKKYGWLSCMFEEGEKRERDKTDEDE